MTDLFADERLQFFLRNREDIKTWAAIEPDVIAATRELLARAQVDVDERLLPLDGQAVVGRHDSGQWERILARHESWPASVGLALEWHRLVEPGGSNRPKIGVFWWADPPSLEERRTRFIGEVDTAPLLALGYKVPLGGVWPVGRFTTALSDWWQQPDQWIASLVDLLASTWPIVAPVIDALLSVEPQVTDG
jgi:hypothetical protein